MSNAENKLMYWVELDISIYMRTENHCKEILVSENKCKESPDLAINLQVFDHYLMSSWQF